MQIYCGIVIKKETYRPILKRKFIHKTFFAEPAAVSVAFTAPGDATKAGKLLSMIILFFSIKSPAFDMKSAGWLNVTLIFSACYENKFNLEHYLPC